MTTWPVIRDVTLFLGGLAGVGHETIIATAERPTLLILFAAMMGLPAFLRQDQEQQQQQSPQKKPGVGTPDEAAS
jgi:choline-glycine betaine transporter